MRQRREIRTFEEYFNSCWTWQCWVDLSESSNQRWVRQ